MNSSSSLSYIDSYGSKTKIFPSINKPYLVGVPDKEEFAPLDTEEKVKEFYSSKIPSYDIESPYYRWEKTWAAGELENVLKLMPFTVMRTLLGSIPYPLAT